MNACQELRWAAHLFPKEPKLLTIGQTQVQIIERLPWALAEPPVEEAAADAPAKPALAQLLQGRPKTLLYVPSSSEIMEHAKAAGSEAAGASAGATSTFDEDYADEAVMQMSRCPTRCAPDAETSLSGRVVNFKEAYNYSAG